MDSLPFWQVLSQFMMVLVVVLVVSGNNNCVVLGDSEYRYSYTISSSFKTCSGGSFNYLCGSVKSAVEHLNNMVKNMMFTKTIITIIFRIQTESTCQVPDFFKRTGFSYRVRFESGSSSNMRGSIFCPIGGRQILSDQDSIVSIEAENIGFTMVDIRLTSAPNATFTNCVFRASSIKLGSFEKVNNKLIYSPRTGSALIFNQVEFPDSTFRAAGYDGIYIDRSLLNIRNPGIINPSFIGNSRILTITNSSLTTKLFIQLVDIIEISEFFTGDYSELSILQAKQVLLDRVDYIGTYSTGSPVLYIGYSDNVVITNCKISMGTNWLFISSLHYLRIANVQIFDSQTQGSMLFISTCRKVEVENLYCSNVRATCLHFKDVKLFNIYGSEFNNVVPNIYNGAFYSTLSYNTIIPSNELDNSIVQNSNFVNCSGSIYIESTSVINIKKCNFYNNFAPKGGAIYYNYMLSTSINEYNVLYVYNCRFIGNGNDYSYGGAIYVIGFSKFQDNYFENNRADRGGVFFFGDRSNEFKLRVEDSNEFHGNTAKDGKIGYSEVQSNSSIIIKDDYYDDSDSISSPCFNFTLTETEKISHPALYLGKQFKIEIEARNIFGRLITTPRNLISLNVNSDTLFLKTDITNFTILFILYSNIEVTEPKNVKLTLQYERAISEFDIVLNSCPPFFRFDSPACVNIFYILPLVTTIGSVTLIATCIAVIGLCFARYKSKLLRKRTRAEVEMEKVLLDKKMIFEESDDNKPTSKASFIIPTEDISIQTRIGEGGQSMIYKGLWKGIEVAIKSIKDQEDEEVFEREGALLISLRHPNIVTMYGFCVPNNTQKYMVIEYMKGGSLEKIISECKLGRHKLSLKEKLHILMEISRGMTYLHSLKPNMICHRDLKPANVLLDDNNSVKICDFGLSRIVGGNTFQTSMTLNVGTLLYCPPENFDSGLSDSELFGNEMSGIFTQSNSSEYAYNFNTNSSNSIGSGVGSSYSKEDRIRNASKIDVYSFGIIMWALFFEEIPYTTFNHKKMNYFTEIPDCNCLSVITQIVRGKRPTIPFSNDDQLKEWTNIFMQPKEKQSVDKLFVEGVSKYIKLTQKCWHQLPQERPTFEEIIQYLYEITRLCDQDPLFM